MATSPKSRALTLALAGTLSYFGANALANTEEFLDLSFEELLEVEVVVLSALRQEQRWFDTAAATYVISADDIRESTATSLPDLLRTVPGLSVSRISSNSWGVNARGATEQYSRFLLVMIDGRSLYRSAFSGLLWDERDMALDDIERIEIIRGPGGAVWGANAVNGIVNVITKSAQATQGVRTAVKYGSDETKITGSYGSTAASGHAFRLTAQHSTRDSLTSTPQLPQSDWDTTRVSVRFDSPVSDLSSYMVSADYYTGTSNNIWPDFQVTAPYSLPIMANEEISGGSLTSQWTRNLESGGSLQLSGYYDRAHRESQHSFWNLDRYEISFQQNFSPAKRHSVAWGLTGRHTISDIGGDLALLRFNQNRQSSNRVGLYIQDVMSFWNDRLEVIAGAKYEHEEVADSSFAPTLRAIWKPTEQFRLWGALSRSVGTPTRAVISSESTVGIIPPGPISPIPVELRLGGLIGEAPNPTLDAAELGLRVAPTDSFYADIAAYYHEYRDDVATSTTANHVALQPVPHIVQPIGVFAGEKFSSHGVETSALWQWSSTSLSTTYTYSREKNRTADQLNFGDVANPRHRLSFHAQHQLAAHHKLDLWVRSATRTPQTELDGYVALDARWGWQVSRNFELSLTARNLTNADRVESSSDVFSVGLYEVPRMILLGLSWRS